MSHVGTGIEKVPTEGIAKYKDPEIEVGLSYSNKCREDNISEDRRGGIILVGDMVRTPQVQTM